MWVKWVSVGEVGDKRMWVKWVSVGEVLTNVGRSGRLSESRAACQKVGLTVR